MKYLSDSVQIHIEKVPVEIIFDRAFKTERKDEKFTDVNATALHLHPNFELFFVSANPLKIVTEDGEYHFKNSVVILPPKLKHYSTIGPGTYRFFIKIDEQRFRSDFIDGFLGIISEERIYHASKNEELFFYLNELEKSIESQNEGSRLKAAPLLKLIFLSTVELFNVKADEKKKETTSCFSEYVLRIENILSTVYIEKITLSYVAKHLYLSEKQVSRIIKKAFNCSLCDLINDKKLSTAAMLLKTTDKPISTIIEEMNFQTESYFFVLFKKKYGTTPLAYRKMNKGGSQQISN